MKPIPSILDLYTKLASDLQSKLGLTDDGLKYALNAFSAVFAAQFKLNYLYLQDNQNQQFPDTADTAANGGTLERLGQIYLNRLPFPAGPGIYAVQVTGVEGADIPSGLTFQADQNSNSPGSLYVLDAEFIMDGDTDTISLRALVPGTSTLLNVGDVLVPTAPVLGITQSVVVTAVTTAPVDGEEESVYRQAILNAIRLQPQGGAKTDYRLWSQDANGVRTVYPYVQNGVPGTVQVFAEAVVEDSIDGNGTPSEALCEAIAAVIEFNPDETLPTNERGRRPIQANVDVLPVTPNPVDIRITGLQVNNAAVQASIKANIIDYLYNIRPYIAGCDLPTDQNDTLTTVRLQSVVSDTLGNTNSFLTFTMFVNGVQSNSYQFSLSNIPYLRNTTFA